MLFLVFDFFLEYTIYHGLFPMVLKSPDGEWPITYTCFSLKWNQGLRPFAAHTYPKFTEVIPPHPRSEGNKDKENLNALPCYYNP